MSLRIIWAGPWNERSAIAYFGTLVIGALEAMGHVVEIMRTETGAEAALPPLSGRRPVHRPADVPGHALVWDYDGVIVNLGNHYGFHGAALPLLWSVPSLAILHDAWMGDFMRGLRQLAGSDLAALDSMLQILDPADDPTGLTPLCGLAAGAVVHGPHYLEAVGAACPGPVFELPLAYTIPDLPRPRPVTDRLTIATIGHVNVNKRVDEVLRAIGASPRLRERTSFFLVGPVEPSEKSRLLDVARRVGAPEPHFTGWVPDRMLQVLMGGLDAICCLRDPITEGGSASLVSAMLSGRPTLVSAHGVYGALPDGLVLKCPPGAEAAHVLHHLERIIDQPEDALAMGARAREYAQRIHGPEAYAVSLVAALEATSQAIPGLRAARALGLSLAQVGVLPHDAATERAASALSGLLNLRG